jgi:hypothetical protein
MYIVGLVYGAVVTGVLGTYTQINVHSTLFKVQIERIRVRKTQTRERHPDVKLCQIIGSKMDVLKDAMRVVDVGYPGLCSRDGTEYQCEVCSALAVC